MEPGSLFLLLLVLIVGGGLVFGVLLMLGVVGKSEQDEEGRRFQRPKHKRVTSETIENTELVGTRSDDDPR
jgi:hypothetical protein